MESDILCHRISRSTHGAHTNGWNASIGLGGRMSPWKAHKVSLTFLTCFFDGNVTKSHF